MVKQKQVLNQYDFIPLLEDNNGKSVALLYAKMLRFLQMNGDNLSISKEDFLDYLKERYGNDYQITTQEIRTVVLTFSEK